MTGGEVGGAIAATAIGVRLWRDGVGELWVGLALNLGRAEARPYIYFREWRRNATASEGRLYYLLDFGGKTLGRGPSPTLIG